MRGDSYEALTKVWLEGSERIGRLEGRLEAAVGLLREYLYAYEMGGRYPVEKTRAFLDEVGGTDAC